MYIYGRMSTEDYVNVSVDFSVFLLSRVYWVEKYLFSLKLFIRLNEL